MDGGRGAERRLGLTRKGRGKSRTVPERGGVDPGRGEAGRAASGQAAAGRGGEGGREGGSGLSGARAPHTRLRGRASACQGAGPRRGRGAGAEGAAWRWWGEGSARAGRDLG